MSISDAGNPRKFSFKEMSRLGKVAFVIFTMMFSTIIFMFLSPYLTNQLGRYYDQIYYEEALKRIEEVRKGTIRIRFENPDSSPVVGMEVGVNQTRHEFLFGAILFNRGRYDLEDGFCPCHNETFERLFKKLMNFAILPFYWRGYDGYHCRDDETRLNESIQFCQDNDMPIKGHCLIWDYYWGYPDWWNLDEMSNDDVMNAIQDRIYYEMTKYKDNITYWDVVNEAIHRGFFGMDVQQAMKQCYAWARDANPDANLIFNDYGMMGRDFGYGTCYRFFEKMNKLGTPYDSIGMQMHLLETDWIPTYEIERTLDAFTRLGKEIHISELFVPSARVPITNSWKRGLWSESAQATYLVRAYTMLFSHPSVKSINHWGFRDGGYNWDKDYEGFGLIDAQFRPKRSYKALYDLIQEQWHTNATLTTDDNGYIEFDGYYGTYNITYSGYSVIKQVNSSDINDFTVVVS